MDNSISTRLLSRPHIDHVYILDSRYINNDSVNYCFHLNMLSRKIDYIIEKIPKYQFGYKYFRHPNNRVLLIASDKLPFKYLQSRELIEESYKYKQTIFYTRCIKDSPYFRTLTNNIINKEEVIPDFNIYEINIPDIKEWKYLDYKSLLRSNQ